MELSKTVGSIAIVLGVVLSAGFAVVEDSATVTPKPTMQMKVEEREAQRRAALDEQQKRRDAFERACNKPMKSDTDRDLCRVAYKRLDVTKQ